MARKGFIYKYFRGSALSPTTPGQYEPQAPGLSEREYQTKPNPERPTSAHRGEGGRSIRGGLPGGDSGGLGRVFEGPEPRKPGDDTGHRGRQQIAVYDVPSPRDHSSPGGRPAAPYAAERIRFDASERIRFWRSVAASWFCRIVI